MPGSLIAPEGRFPRALEMAYMWAILRASNVKLTADGLEHVEQGRSYIVMANHRSMYDIPVLHYLLGQGRDLRRIGSPVSSARWKPPLLNGRSSPVVLRVPSGMITNETPARLSFAARFSASMAADRFSRSIAT